MPSILNLKFKVGPFPPPQSDHRAKRATLPLTHPPPFPSMFFQGNKSFVAFSNLGETDSLTKTWKVRSIFISHG